VLVVTYWCTVSSQEWQQFHKEVEMTVVNGCEYTHLIYTVMEFGIFMPRWRKRINVVKDVAETL
jgi:hypothetical protein